MNMYTTYIHIRIIVICEQNEYKKKSKTNGHIFVVLFIKLYFSINIYLLRIPAFAGYFCVYVGRSRYISRVTGFNIS